MLVVLRSQAPGREDSLQSHPCVHARQLWFLLHELQDARSGSEHRESARSAFQAVPQPGSLARQPPLGPRLAAPRTLSPTRRQVGGAGSAGGPPPEVLPGPGPKLELMGTQTLNQIQVPRGHDRRWSPCQSDPRLSDPEWAESPRVTQSGHQPGAQLRPG